MSFITDIFKIAEIINYLLEKPVVFVPVLEKPARYFSGPNILKLLLLIVFIKMMQEI